MCMNLLTETPTILQVYVRRLRRPCTVCINVCIPRDSSRLSWSQRPIAQTYWTRHWFVPAESTARYILFATTTICNERRLVSYVLCLPNFDTVIAYWRTIVIPLDLCTTTGRWISWTDISIRVAESSVELRCWFQHSNLALRRVFWCGNNCCVYGGGHAGDWKRYLHRW